MKRTIQDVDGDVLTITTETQELRDWRTDDQPSFVVALRPANDMLLDLPKLDELIEALQEARDEIVKRDAPPSSPAGHADV